MAKTAKRKTVAKKTNHTDDSNFLLIVGGGFVVLILIFMTSGMMFGGGSGNSNTTDVQASVKASESVAINELGFTPKTLTVSKGTTITWTNNDTSLHTVIADDGSFDTGNLYNGESGSVAFEKAGTFEYHDQSNPEMRGEIVVE